MHKDIKKMRFAIRFLDIPFGHLETLAHRQIEISNNLSSLKGVAISIKYKCKAISNKKNDNFVSPNIQYK